jgi:hypothetical protein
MTDEKSPPREIPPATGVLAAVEGAAPRATAQYEVSVYTGDVPGAGTDGAVWVWFDGTLGRSGWIYLDNRADNFERNQRDRFEFELEDVGQTYACWVYFIPSGIGSDWFLSDIGVFKIAPDTWGITFNYMDWITNRGMYALDRG